MRHVRVIPTLLMRKGGLVKTVKFDRAVYVGDPINTVRIFNDKEVDEIVVLDIDATKEGREPSVERIKAIAGECFMPLGYGGGVTTVEQMGRILYAGAEKIVVNSALVTHPAAVSEGARRFGSQAIVASIDVRKRFLGGYRAYTHGGTRRMSDDPVAAARRAVELGAGEILLSSIDRDGTYEGYDLDVIRSVASAVPVPVIAAGGARNVGDFLQAVQAGKASAVAAGSIFVFHGVHRAVLVNFPSPSMLKDQLFLPLTSGASA